jgi:hypothetical protein
MRLGTNRKMFSCFSRVSSKASMASVTDSVTDIFRLPALAWPFACARAMIKVELLRWEEMVGEGTRVQMSRAPAAVGLTKLATAHEATLNF